MWSENGKNIADLHESEPRCTTVCIYFRYAECHASFSCETLAHTFTMESSSVGWASSTPQLSRGQSCALFTMFAVSWLLVPPHHHHPAFQHQQSVQWWSRSRSAHSTLYCFIIFHPRHAPGAGLPGRPPDLHGGGEAGPGVQQPRRLC